MKINYLSMATNLQELKSLYFKLAKQYHPDLSTGNLEIMKQINNEYDYLKTVLKNADNTKQAEQESTDTLETFKDIIDQLIKYETITIQVVGSWLWIYDVKKEDKEIHAVLKENKFFYNSKRNIWQRKPEEDLTRKFKNSKESDAEIKNRYGCKTIATGARQNSFAIA
jgi:curved DNA-binding protein CbpA